MGKRNNMMRYDIINWFINRYSYYYYLEIGTENPSKCFNKINCNYKRGIEPRYDRGKLIYKMTSDEFFKINNVIFDIIFVDG